MIDRDHDISEETAKECAQGLEPGQVRMNVHNNRYVTVIHVSVSRGIRGPTCIVDVQDLLNGGDDFPITALDLGPVANEMEVIAWMSR